MNYQDLKILDELREKGSISEEEYQREKAKILNRPATTPLWGMEENTYLMLMHLSQLITAFILPLIMWLANKDLNENIDKHGKNIMNFIISYTIYSLVLCVTIIGIPIAGVLGIVCFIFIIMAAIKANSGIYWQYPLTIQFFK